MKSFCHLLDVADLKELVASGEGQKIDCRIVDCRFDLLQPEKGRVEYLAGHIPGAVFADLDRDLAGPVTDSSGRHPLPDPEVFKATLEDFGIDANTQVVAYDYASGALAARLWWLLRWFGHARVAVLNGGLKAWLAGNGALQTEVPDYPATELSASPDAGRVATTAEISDTISEGGELYLVDARDRSRFDGLTEPIDTVAGHIPGALNFPFSENIDAEGKWKSADELRRLWAGILGCDSPPPVTVMCGSGVTACHLALSAEVAGLKEPRVYVGSWSEWIRDASRPVAGA
jgi:thiosulfate/3-mercaptopyruvate sulfurtransferase